MIEVKNRRVVIPFVDDIQISVPKNLISYDRKENTFSGSFSGTFSISLPFAALCTELTEVYIDGMRKMNPRLYQQFGGTYHGEYNVFNSFIAFTNAISGDVKVVCETQPYPEPHVNVIQIDNTQGYLSAGISLFHEPVVVSEPANGYARLSFDRKELVYLPKLGFTGNDSFSYTLINNQGQFGKPKCVYITVV
jgi:hypothetical protein